VLYSRTSIIWTAVVTVLLGYVVNRCLLYFEYFCQVYVTESAYFCALLCLWAPVNIHNIQYAWHTIYSTKWIGHFRLPLSGQLVWASTRGLYLYHHIKTVRCLKSQFLVATTSSDIQWTMHIVFHEFKIWALIVGVSMSNWHWVVNIHIVCWLSYTITWLNATVWQPLHAEQPSLLWLPVLMCSNVMFEQYHAAQKFLVKLLKLFLLLVTIHIHL